MIVIPAKSAPADEDDEVAEARRERLRRDPTVIWHTRTNFEPFVSGIRVTHPVDVLELIGRCDDDDCEDPPSRP